ncbi:hypothetical protein FKM82_007074 [Ascaphus truei]
MGKGEFDWLLREGQRMGKCEKKKKKIIIQPGHWYILRIYSFWPDDDFLKPERHPFPTSLFPCQEKERERESE